jgi:hypothetical protein
MWYFNGQIIKTPKSMVISDVLYPKQSLEIVLHLPH